MPGLIDPPRPFDMDKMLRWMASALRTEAKLPNVKVTKERQHIYRFRPSLS